MKFKIKPVFVHTAVCVGIIALIIVQQNELARSYKAGLAYAEQGNYEYALSVMNSIAEYRNAPTKVKEYKAILDYQKGCELIEEEKWDEALEQFELVLSWGEYEDAEEKKYTCIYEKARALAFSGDIRGAELLYVRLPLTFKDVEARKTVISENKKFAGKWKCSTNNLDLKTQVYVDYDNIARIRAVMSDSDGLLLDEPVTLNGEGMEINVDRFSWAIYGTDSFSFVYGKDKYTVMKQPVTEGTKKYEFDRVVGTDYDALNLEYTNTDY